MEYNMQTKEKTIADKKTIAERRNPMKQWMLFAVLSLAIISGDASYAGMHEHMGKDADNAEKMALSATDYTKEAEAAGVKVKVSLDNPGEAAPPVFTITLDTHSVDIGQFKIEGSLALRDDAGKTYGPSLVSESGSSHHRSITIEFKDADITPLPYAEVIIKGLAGIDERVFRFDAPQF